MLRHKFIEFIPEKTEDGILYISMEYCTAIHKCVCGCGNKVVTPLSPTGWKLTFNGKTVTLDPSIGNWNFECQSHYWIRDNEVEFASRWTEKEIRLGRENDLERRKKYFGEPDISKEESAIPKSSKPTIWQRIFRFFLF
ncbi:DUF6527 family protein [Emticicia sp. CRIBPO]|uniref:DUF6527 family protein n=1 Tax=Emticicia sp. CRIBPO TaxID=2683258 RepID=UPI00197A77C2|nr:DUF6527 family protein [Emticicia sp. CRIBPO]